MTILHIDVETISEVDLKRTGVFRYAEDPTTKVIVFCYAFDDDPVQTWLPQQDPIPEPLKEHIEMGGRCLAWNAQFEKTILQKCLNLYANFSCSMATAAYYSYPLSLDMAAEAVGLPIGKDKVGKSLMLRMCKPRSYDPHGKPVWWHETDPDKFLRLQLYCLLDVVLERSIGKKMKSLPAAEEAVWLRNENMNERGVRLDTDLVSKLHQLVMFEQNRLDQAMRSITGGVVSRCSQVAKLKQWIFDTSGLIVTSLDKDNINMLLNNAGRTQLHSCVRQALELRQEAAKSSTAKLKAMSDCAGYDYRMRGLIQYYGAMRTGRFAGRLAQPHNYPRPEIDKPENAIAYIKAGMTVAGVRAFWGSPMAVVSSCLRGCFIPADDHVFLSIDFSQIEARVLAWLTDQRDVLKVFADGGDVYTHAANKIGSKDRHLGKVLTLACGYGMGGAKFRETANKQGMNLDEEFAQEAVDKWRMNNVWIVTGWKTLERICTDVGTGHKNSGATVFARKLRITRIDNALVITLPGGRELFYQEIAMIEGRFGHAQLSYMGLNSYTRKWERIETYGGKLIENVVQAIARDLLVHAIKELRWQHVFSHLVLTVHDELLLEIHKDKPQAYINVAVDIVKHGPDWAKGIPLSADWWIGDRYQK